MKGLTTRLIQDPYNNNYYQATQNGQWVYSPQPYFKHENHRDIRPDRHNEDYEDCLYSGPPRRSPEGFRWIRIYPYFTWNGHYWVRQNVRPHWALIDDLHPCDPHTPGQ